MDSIEMLAFSGIRPGESAAVMGIIDQCGLPIEDITPAMLKDFLIARKGADIIGVVGLEISSGDALLRSLAVTEVHRRMGIGLKLIKSAERYARSRRIETLYLLTLTAETIFRQAGYSVIDRSSAPVAMQATREFKTLCPDTAVCMKKEISH
jgi:amino-acid N-acetyltransferase